ncbi:MAG: type IV secretion system DNA-binding domain-containing protein, partial [Patescibacteria group bacterium]|nr:type IV secretion system DNA-binding domain-containing protein [Patescibacteria group bacterium]
MYDENAITYFAETDARNKRVKFGIKAKDRTKHVYVIGKTGMGKSTVLENMAVQDIQNGEGMAFIDPHGKTAELLLDYIPEHRKKDVVYFAPFDLDYPISFNVLEQVDADKRHLVVSGLMSTFKKIWQDAWSARMEYILTNTLLALLEYPGATLLGVNRMYADKEFRKDVVAHVTDPTVKAFWTEEFAKYTDKFAAEATPAIQNKVGQFTSNALIRNMIGQPKSSFDLRKILDEKKIMIINLSKGRVGEQNANLLGGMLITKIYLAAMSRADASPALMRTLPQFYLYVDEFQSFANESFADILSEARKYKLNLTMAHQYIEQMEEEVRAAVFGNVGTMIVFRVGAYDAEVLEKEFFPTFTAEDIVNLGVYQIYLKLMIDGVSSQPFSATTLLPIALPPVSPSDEVKALSRQQFAHTRADVEKAIADWLAPIKVAPQPAKVSPPSVKAAPLQTPPPAQSAIKPVTPVGQNDAPRQFVTKPEATKVAPASVKVTPPPLQKPVDTHKPFANAFKTMEADTVPARAREIEDNVDKNLPQVTLVKDPNQKKTIPLADLSQGSAKKIPSPERVNDLKAALAKAMANKEESKKENEKSKIIESGEEEKKEIENRKIEENKEIRKDEKIESVKNDQMKVVVKVETPAQNSSVTPSVTQLKSLVAPAQPISEVPEDVLRKALSTD